MRRLILRSHQSPGDVLMLTAAVRDLHRANPGRFQTDVRTPAGDLWKHSPYLTPLTEGDESVETIDMHYPLIHESNQRPWHFLQGYGRYLEETLEVRVPLSDFKGDVHLSDEERDRSALAKTFGLPDRYWIVVAGGKFDFTAKWWNPASFQRVVDLLRDRVAFVQCGEGGHWHPPLEGVTNLVGKTGLRQFLSLTHFADGVLCPVTFAMHLAAAVEPYPGGPKNRPCVVVAGGREPPHWEAYPHHQFISTVGTLSCCSSGGCWKSRCQQVGDGDTKDRRGLCEQPVQVAPELQIPRCMTMITPEDVVRRIEYYLDGDQPRAPLIRTKLSVAKPARNGTKTEDAAASRRQDSLPIPVRIEGAPWSVAALPATLNHLRRYRPGVQFEPDIAPDQLPWAAALGLEVVDDEDSLRAGRTLRLSLPDPSAHSSWPPTPVANAIASQLRLTPIEDLCRLDAKKPKRDLRENATLKKLGVAIADAETRLVVAQFPKARRCEHAGGMRQLALAAAERNAAAVMLIGDFSRADDFVLGYWWDQNATSWKRFDKVEPDDIAALLEASSLFVGADSPLLNWAAATGAPCLALWCDLHPLFAAEESPRTVHLMKPTHVERLQTDRERRRFETAYRHQVAEDPPEAMTEACLALLDPPEDPAAARLRGRAPQPVRQKPEPAPTTNGHVVSSAPVRRPPPARRESAATGKKQGAPKDERICVRFEHGLGDSAHFARLVRMYVDRGYRIGVACPENKRILFEAAGAEIVPTAEAVHAWGYPPEDVPKDDRFAYRGSKAGWNISQAPLPDIGDKGELWNEYCRTQVRLAQLIPPEDRQIVEEWLHGLPRPIVLLHTKGNTGQRQKSLPDDVAAQLYRELLDRFDGSLVLLDWDDRVPRLDVFRVRHLSTMPRGCPTSRFYALMEAADLLVGVDSGPFHAASLTDTARIGVWMPGHYPARYSLPDDRQLNLVLSGATGELNRYHRVPWNIVEQAGHRFDPVWLAMQCVRMLEPPRYLDREHAARDVQLRQWIGEWCRSPRTDLAAEYSDRNRSFDALLREATASFERPTFVETGTIRSEDDFAGAGYSTYVFGAYIAASGGKLHSVDLSKTNARFAARQCEVYGDAVTVHCRDSIGFLAEFDRPIDVLYLDSLDTYEPGHAEHAMRELQAALPKLHKRSLILLDDTPFGGNSFTGKGALAVPWLLEHGWELLYAGRQALLRRASR